MVGLPKEKKDRPEGGVIKLRLSFLLTGKSAVSHFCIPIKMFQDVTPPTHTEFHRQQFPELGLG
jgi:hypothetical protein